VAEVVEGREEAVVVVSGEVAGDMAVCLSYIAIKNGI
jgi:hypothetical protein